MGGVSACAHTCWTIMSEVGVDAYESQSLTAVLLAGGFHSLTIEGELQ